jgi:ankyrin repeat protein
MQRLLDKIFANAISSASSSNSATSNVGNVTTSSNSGGSASRANQEAVTTLTKQQITDFFNHVHANNVAEVSRLIDENREYLHCREDTEWKYTALHWASQKGFDRMVAALIERGVDVGIEASKYNWKAIHLACRFGHPKVVTLLLDAGEDVNVVQDDDDRANAIHWAAQFGHEEVFNLLLARGADWTFKNAKGNSLIHIGACYGFNFVIDKCIELGCSVDMKTDNKWEYTGLHWAAQFDKPHVIRHLISKGANIHLKSKSNNFTPLELAEKYKNVECVKILMDQIQYEKEMEWYRIMAPSRKMYQRQKEGKYVDLAIICQK